MSTTRHKIAAQGDFMKDGDRIIEEIEGIEIAVFRIDGEYYALANFCPHQSGPLCEGPVRHTFRGSTDGWSYEREDDQVIACPWHGWRFNVKSGKSVDAEEYSIPKYDVVVENGDVFVEM